MSMYRSMRTTGHGFSDYTDGSDIRPVPFLWMLIW